MTCGRVAESFVDFRGADKWPERLLPELDVAVFGATLEIDQHAGYLLLEIRGCASTWSRLMSLSPASHLKFI
jgi:hypothetical protein